MFYIEQLLTKEWKAKRFKILSRDNFKCTCCGNTKELQVHHKKYIKDKLAWEYKDSFLKTLCKNCHSDVHKNKPISSFIESNNKKAKSKKERVAVRIKKMYDGMSKKDLEVQKLYDKRKSAV